MRGMRIFLSLGGLVLLLGSFAFGADIYITQNISGGDSGANCANAHSAAWFNSNAAGGNTYHLCGKFTFTANAVGLTVPASGTSGASLVILFETDTVLQSPYFPGTTVGIVGSTYGAINAYNRNYIIIDGGTNGIIQNTDNGSASLGYTYHQPSFGVFAKGTGITIRNLTIRNIYMNEGASQTATDGNGQNSAGIVIGQNSTQVKVCSNTISNSRYGLTSSATDSGKYVTDCSSNTFSAGVNVFLNTFADHAWHIELTGDTSYPNIYANDISDATNWQCPAAATYCTGGGGDIYHTDGIFAYGTATNGIVHPFVFWNYFHGSLGQASSTGNVSCTYGASGSGSACTVFANLFDVVNTSFWSHADTTTNPLGPHKLYNNTFVTIGTAASFGVKIDGDPYTQYVVKNNIFSNSTGGYYYSNSSYGQPFSTLTVNDNFYWNAGTSIRWDWGGAVTASFDTWKTNCTNGSGTGCDANGANGNPLLDGNYKLQASSPAIGHGENLTSLCTGQMAPLCYDKPPNVGRGGSLSGSNPRPSSGAWDIGAYQYSSSSGIVPPASLIAVAH